MKFSRNITAVFAAVCIAAFLAQGIWAAPVSNSQLDARTLVDSLYAPKGVLPIRDLVLELECCNTDPTSGNFVISSKDKIYFKHPNLLRIDSIIQDPGGPMDQKQLIVIRDGMNAWHYVSMGQYPVKKAKDLPSPTLNIPFNIQKYKIDLSKVYTYKGQKTIEKVNTTEIKITNPQDEGDTKTVYVDVARHVPLRLELTDTNSDKKTVLKRAEYKDIRKMEDGRWFPFKIELYENDVLKKIRLIKGAQANVGLEDNLFKPMNRFTR